MMVLEDNQVEAEDDYKKIFQYYDRTRKGYFQY